MNIENKIDRIFQTHFSEVGNEVRPEQRIVIESVLAGNNTLALMPTGSGKSLCYWIAAKALGGITLVIFPLTALMDEQAAKLAQHGCQVLTLHSGKDPKKQYSELISLYNGQEKPGFIFLSPERLATDGFLEFVLRHIKNQLKLVVVDEAHCISQWGLNFRPFYKEIPFFLDNVFGAAARPLILCLTATLNPKEREDICRDFDIASNNVIKSELLLRYSIHLRVVKVSDEKEKDALFWQELEQHKNEKLLVYIENRSTGERSTEGLCKKALERGFTAAYFHADMKTDEKGKVIEDYKSGKIMVVFATSAFGMGIDIPDIRGVIHYRPPESTEQYYQQIGRVGRDGKPAWALLYYSDKNVSFRKSHFIEQSFPTTDQIREAFDLLSNNRIGNNVVNYFDDAGVQAAYHYLIRSRVMRVVCKGVQDLTIFETARDVKLPEFESYLQATPTGSPVIIAMRTNTAEPEIMEHVYGWLAKKKITTPRSPAKCLIVESFSDALPDDMLDQILADAEAKKAYVTSILDEFVEILESYTDSTHLHQAIGEYLGVDKFQLGRIHETLVGDRVRSKSEVIIANLLFERNIPFIYELKLHALDGSGPYSPDFTIDWNGKRYFWEHWGLYEMQDYRQKMDEKIAWYNQHFPGQLIETFEANTLSKDAEKLVNQHFTK